MTKTKPQGIQVIQLSDINNSDYVEGNSFKFRIVAEN